MIREAVRNVPSRLGIKEGKLGEETDILERQAGGKEILELQRIS